MPLKHSTETLLTIILGGAIIAAGILAAVLPAFPAGALVWGISFLVALAYPLALYPLFKERRADYTFRFLHFLPALILLGRFILELLAPHFPIAQTLENAYTWNWSLPAVVASLAGLIRFCLRVLRQRASRLATLLAIFIPFVALPIALPFLSGGVPNNPPVIVGTTMSSSSRPSAETDEKWLIEQRRMQRRADRLADWQNKPVTVRGAVTGMLISTITDNEMSSGSSSSAPPPHLPSSGMETQVLFVTLIAVYCGVLHQRAKRRNYEF